MRFRKGDGLAETVYLGFVVVLCLFALYGNRSGFEPSLDWAYLTGRYCWILGAIFFIPVFLDRNPRYRLDRSPAILFTAGPLTYGVLVLFSYQVMSYSFPAVHAKHFGVPFEASVKVVDTERSVGRYRKCSYIIVAEDSSLLGVNYELCAKRRLWEKVKSGDTLRFSGKETRFGRLVTHMTAPAPIEPQP